MDAGQIIAAAFAVAGMGAAWLALRRQHYGLAIVVATLGLAAAVVLDFM